MFVVPKQHQTPLLSIRDFYRERDKLLHEYMFITRTTFEKQPFLGSVFKDGFHAFLPPNSKWQGHKIEISESIGKEIELARNESKKNKTEQKK